MDFTISCTTILEYLKLYGSVMHHEIQILMYRKGNIAGYIYGNICVKEDFILKPGEYNLFKIHEIILLTDYFSLKLHLYSCYVCVSRAFVSSFVHACVRACVSMIIYTSNQVP